MNVFQNSWLVLIASLAVAWGSWLTHFQNWHEAVTVGSIGSMVMTTGGVLLAWLGKSPIKPSS